MSRSTPDDAVADAGQTASRTLVAVANVALEAVRGRRRPVWPGAAALPIARQAAWHGSRQLGRDLEQHSSGPRVPGPSPALYALIRHSNRRAGSSDY
jgi:hypothetical protein